MEDIPLSAQATTLIVLLVVSGFFAMAETAMMASNRYRLRVAAQAGEKAAQLAIALLAKTDKLLGVILLFNTLINAAAATLAGLITVQLFGDEKWILGAGTLTVSFMILVFAEITPKVIGAAYADRLTLISAYFLSPILRLTDPIISVINLMVKGLLRLLRLRGASAEGEQVLTPEELRVVVLESAHGIPTQHRRILLNLFDLEHITVDDVMTPRGAIEALDINDPLDDLRQKMATSYHTRLPVYEGDPGNVIGIIHQRRLLAQILDGQWSRETVREHLSEPYFIPAGTHIYAQLQFFQENRQRLGLVVDEYGELQGLLTLEDIIEEMIGKFTTSTPGGQSQLRWDDENSVLVDGARSLRELNRALGIDLPTDGPKTLNGLILEHFEDIPESGISAKIHGVAMEILQTQDRAVKIVRLFRPSA